MYSKKDMLLANASNWEENTAIWPFFKDSRKRRGWLHKHNCSRLARGGGGGGACIHKSERVIEPILARKSLKGETFSVTVSSRGAPSGLISLLIRLSLPGHLAVLN